MGSSVVLVQDWLTLRGLGGSPAVNFDQGRPDWLFVGDAQGVVLSVEISELTSISGPPPVKPALLIQTAVSEDGPWTDVAIYTVAGVQTPVFLRRNPGDTSAQQMMGFLRWRLQETENGDEWTVCFRVTAAIERA